MRFRGSAIYYFGIAEAVLEEDMASRTPHHTHVETNPHYARPSQEGRLRPTLPGTASRVDAWGSDGKVDLGFKI